jgi:hypothetical protein
VEAKTVESRILLSHAPIDTFKVMKENTIFNLAQDVALSKAASSALATKRMQKPNQLITLSIDDAIESGKTLIGQLGKGTEPKTKEGDALCRDDKKKDYWSY